MTELSSRESGVLSEETVARTILGELEAGRPLVVATVISTNRSVPRRSGAKMLVFRDGRTIGSIGGGEMEARVKAAARGAFEGNTEIQTLTYDLVDAAAGDAGVCGGTADIMIEPKYPKPTLLIVGCGHVGRAVADLARWLGYRVVATDDRVELATNELMPSAHIVVPGTIHDALAKAELDWDSSVVLVTRNVAVDVELLPVILQTRAQYVGVMGSRRRWSVTQDHLRAANVTTEQLGRIHNPIGLEIGAETPEEIAVSIMGEVVKAKRSVN